MTLAMLLNHSNLYKMGLIIPFLFGCGISLEICGAQYLAHSHSTVNECMVMTMVTSVTPLTPRVFHNKMSHQMFTCSMFLGLYSMLVS